MIEFNVIIHDHGIESCRVIGHAVTIYGMQSTSYVWNICCTPTALEMPNIILLRYPFHLQKRAFSCAFKNSVKMGKYQTVWICIVSMLANTDKRHPCSPWSGVLALGCDSWSFDVALATKPIRQCDKVLGRVRGSCSEVWALHVAISW